MRKASLLIILIIQGFCVETFAQNPYIRHYTTLDGLPSNTIYQIYQDSHKLIWFTSDAGVSSFDGSHFIIYRKKNGLSSNDAVRIKEDNTGRIWIFNYNGSVNYIYNNKVYNGKNAPFLNSFVGNGFILDFFTDSDKTIYFYNWLRDVFWLKTNNKLSKEILLKNRFSVLLQSKTSSSRFKITNISKTSSDQWNIWTNGGLYRLENFRNNKEYIIDSTLKCEAVFPARNNTFYIWTSYKGPTYLSSSSGELIKVSGNFKKEKISFPGSIYKIKTIIEDSEGYLWISAYDEGVYCMKNNKVIKHFNIENALGLLEDHENNIWISSQSEGVYVINHDLLEQNHFNRTNFDNLGINQLCNFPGEGLWCINSEAAFLLNNDNFYKLSAPKYIQPVNIMYLFKDHTLMLGSISQMLYTFENPKLNVFTKKISFSKRTPHSVLTKKIVTDLSGNEVALFDQNRVLFTKALKPALNSGFNSISERINNAYYNAKNEFVINAKKNYLYKNNKLLPYPQLSRFDGMIISDHLVIDNSAELFNIDGDSLYIFKNNKFYNLTDAFDTPIDLQINKILYKDSTLYIATLKDVFVCRHPTNVFSGNSLQLTPLNISFNNINDILEREDTLYIASDDGLTVIPETSALKNSTPPPIPYLQAITVNDKVFTLPDKELKLTGKNNINLSFGCISYSSSPVIFSYMLEGSDKKWTVETGNGVNLVYRNLPKGHYVFKLRVRKSNSGWSKPLEMVITIKPTLFEHPLFWTLVALISLGLIFLIISLIRIQKMKRVEIDHQLIVMEQKSLQSMMNPHFIFNSLGSIQSYLLKDKGSEAVVYLAEFAQLIRQNLNAINRPMILLDEEVDRIRNYLELEKKRLENSFDYSIEIDPQFEEESIYIPSMIIQPMAENSIWHGIAALGYKGFIKISFKPYRQKSMQVIIEDNGIGMKKSFEYASNNSHHENLGKKILEKRLFLLGKKYNTETSIKYSEQYSDAVNPGTKVEIILPLIYDITDPKGSSHIK